MRKGGKKQHYTKQPACKLVGTTDREGVVSAKRTVSTDQAMIYACRAEDPVSQ